MPTPLMDLKGFSSTSYFSEDGCFPCEGQVPYCKSAALPDQYGTAGGKAYASPPLQKSSPVNSHRTKSLDHSEPFLLQDQNMSLSLDHHALQNTTEIGGGQSLALLRSLDHNAGSIASLNALQASYYAQGNKVNAIGPQYENSLFSSSVPELFSRKLKISSDHARFEHTVGNVASVHEEGVTFALPEEIEAQTIGNLLPDDDDLLSGVTEGLDFFMQPNSDDADELDFFSSVGGMDLGESENSVKQKYLKSGSNGSAAGEHFLGHSPSRTLFVRNIDGDAEDSELRTLFEQYGDIRTLYTACKHHGYIMISYYDIRAARKALEYLQNGMLKDRKLEIRYSTPKENPPERNVSQGMLIASNVDHAISNDEVHQIFGVYGDIKKIQSIPYREHQRFIEFYDSRDAEAAFHALNGSSISGKQIKLDPIHPGRMKDLLESPYGLQQGERNVFLQQSSLSNHSAPSFPGHSSLGIDNGAALGMQSAMQIPFLQSALRNRISSDSVSNGLPSLLRVGSVGNQSGLSQAQMKFDVRESAKFHAHSLPDYQDCLINGIHHNSLTLMGTNFNQRTPETIDSRQLHRLGSNGHSMEQGVFGSAGSGSSPMLGNHYMWGANSYRSQPPSMMWPNSPSFTNSIHTSHPSARLQGLTGGQPQLLNTVLPGHAQNHHVGSAPAVNPTIWERQQQSYAVGSPETSILHPGSLGTMRISKNSLHSMDLVPHNIFGNVNGNCMDLSVPPSKLVGLQSPHQRCMMFPGRVPMMPSVGSFDPPSERVRSRRNEGAPNLADKKQYELDIERIVRGEDTRTTLMIKNIPNKYTSKMLLAAIDEQHRGTYDFIYLPIDFKNKCNVGYAFINMTDPSQIVPFYKAFNGKKWDKFNSEKVASLAYARIQGKSALIAHFQNSSLMNEDRRCRPILFNTEGPNAGDQVPFPMGVNVRSRPGKARSSFLEENHQGSPPSSGTGGGDASLGPMY